MLQQIGHTWSVTKHQVLLSSVPNRFKVFKDQKLNIIIWLNYINCRCICNNKALSTETKQISGDLPPGLIVLITALKIWTLLKDLHWQLIVHREIWETYRNWGVMFGWKFVVETYCIRRSSQWLFCWCFGPPCGKISTMRKVCVK